MQENYLPFFRKYRPQSFKDIVGQKSLVKALSNAVELKRIANAYLFSGPRGTGKTSMARIFAKSLNCEKGVTTEPCQTCASCTDITNATGLDVIEIDAASNRGIDDAKELISKAQYAPLSGKYKIFIIDEVHMLSKDAFNALLKTFEEPPKNVIFILATTEPHKVLETIISRCQRYDFRRISIDDIVEKLDEISKKENIKISNGALFAIAKSSNGGLRDSLALLDQVSILGTKNEIVEADIEALVGKIAFKPMFELTEAILNNNSALAVSCIEKMLEAGSEPRNLVENLIEFLKNVVIILASKDVETVKKLTLVEDSDVEIIKSCSLFEKNAVNSLLAHTINFYRDIKTATNPYLWLDLLVIEAAMPKENSFTFVSSDGKNVQNFKNSKVQNVKEEKKTVYKEANEQLLSLDNTLATPNSLYEREEKLNENIAANCNQSNSVNQNNNSSDEFSDIKNVQASSLEPSLNVNEVWANVIEAIQSPLAKAFFKGTPQSVDIDDTCLTVGFAFPNLIVQANGKMNALKDAVSEVISKKIEVRFTQVSKGECTITLPQHQEKAKLTAGSSKNYYENDFQDVNEQKKDDNINKNAQDISSYSQKTKMYLETYNGKVVD